MGGEGGGLVRSIMARKGGGGRHDWSRSKIHGWSRRREEEGGMIGTIGQYGRRGRGVSQVDYGKDGRRGRHD